MIGNDIETTTTNIVAELNKATFLDNDTTVADESRFAVKDFFTATANKDKGGAAATQLCTGCACSPICYAAWLCRESASEAEAGAEHQVAGVAEAQKAVACAQVEAFAYESFESECLVPSAHILAARCPQAVSQPYVYGENRHGQFYSCAQPE
jgi:hypothetical protein